MGSFGAESSVKSKTQRSSSVPPFSKSTAMRPSRYHTVDDEEVRQSQLFYPQRQDSQQPQAPAATSYYFHQNYLSFDETQNSESPNKMLVMSNQNALLNIMSHEDLEGIRHKIHQRITRVGEDDSAQMQGKKSLKTRRPTVL